MPSGDAPLLIVYHNHFLTVYYLWKVLSDPNRRRQYDLSGGDEEAKSADYQPVDMEGIGSMG